MFKNNMLINSKKYTETANLDLSKILKDITLDQYLETIGDEPLNEKDENFDCEKWVDILRQFCKKIDLEKKIFNSYSFGKGHTEGREYANGLSLQYIKREFRGILCDGIYYDFDMINCAPSILRYLCRINNIECEEVDKYCNNRNKMFQTFCSDDAILKDEAKILFIKSLNSEYNVVRLNNKKHKPKITNKFFLEFDNEIKDIQDKLTRIYKDEFNYIKNNETKNINGKFLSYLLRKYEAKILNEVEEASIEIDIKMFDGFLILCKKVKCIETLIDKLNNITKEYDIKWSNKEHDTSILEKVLSLEMKEKKEIVANDLQEIAEILFEDNKDKLVLCNDILYYKSPFGWIKNEKKSENYITNYISKCFKFIRKKIKIDDEYKTIYKEVRSLKDNNEIYRFLTIFVVENRNDNLLEEIQSFCFQKLYYNNGYYDIRQNKFIETDDFNTLVRIEKKFIEEHELKKEMKFIYDELLNPIFTCDKKSDKNREQLRDNYLYTMSRILFGHYRDKNWYSVNGMRNGGKSLKSDLFQKSFGNYVETTNGENFLIGGDKGARSKSYLVDFIGKRLIICNELELENEHGKQNILDGNKIKSFCSGGDRICARKNHGQEEYFYLECCLMFCLNDLPQIRPADAKETQVEYPLTTIFLDKDEYEKKKHENNSNKIFRYYLKNDNLKKEITDNNRIHLAYFHILKNAYLNGKMEYPNELKLQNEIDDDSDYTKFFNFFDFENATFNDNLTLKEIQAFTRSNGINFDAKKCKTQLINKGIHFKRANVGMVAMKLKFK
jgi:hypothetical protein